MHIQNISGIWHIIDHKHQTITTSKNFTNAIQNALIKYRVYDNTTKPEGNAYDCYMRSENMHAHLSDQCIFTI